MRSWHCRLWLNVLCNSAGPSVQFLNTKHLIQISPVSYLEKNGCFFWVGRINLELPDAKDTDLGTVIPEFTG